MYRNNPIEPDLFLPEAFGESRGRFERTETEKPDPESEYHKREEVIRDWIERLQHG